MAKRIKITINHAGQRVDIFLAQKLDVSRAKVQKLITQDLVKVNQKSVSKHYSLKLNDVVEIQQEPKINKPNASDFKLKIIKQTADYVVLDKPAGLVVHPDQTHPQGATLIDLVINKFPEIRQVGEDAARPGVVHRLDKNVSGVMVIARTQAMYEHLKRQFKERQVKKEYLALVHGAVTREQTIKSPISRGSSGRMAAHSEGRSAETAIKPFKNFSNSTLLKVNIKTGRTHQIKVHLLSIGHPIVGEKLYIGKKYKYSKLGDIIDRPFLHAHKLEFRDLESDITTYSSKLPEVLDLVLASLTKKS